MIGSTFVARDKELVRLEQLLALSNKGQGQLCFISGEAGAGKTALLTTFTTRALNQEKELVVAIGTCSSHTGISDPYLPFRQILALLTGDVEGELGQKVPSQENESRLKNLLRYSGQAIVELGPDLLDIFVPGSGIITRAGAFLAEKVGWLDGLEILEKQKKASPVRPPIDPSRIVEQYIAVVKELARDRTLILGIDDLQWADPSSLDLLFQLGRQLTDSRLLLIGTYRPEEVALGRGSEYHPLNLVLGDLKRYSGDIQIDLDGAESEQRDFVWSLVDSQPNRLGEQFRQDLLHHTSGHALFTVELLRELRERGDLKQDNQGFWIVRTGFSWKSLPSKVEGVIETRIGRLKPGDREILDIAAVEGEKFTAEIIAQIQNMEPIALVRQLSAELARKHHLITAEGVEHIGDRKTSRYRFNHVLFQTYLYATLHEAERAYLHESVGAALEELYGERSQEIAVPLSHHFTQSDNWEKAVHYLLLAGNQAHSASAYGEAIEAYSKGLDLVEEIPDATSKRLNELMLDLALGNTLMTTKGAADSRVQKVFKHAIEIAQQVDDTPQSFVAIRGLSLHSKMRGEYEISEAFEQQMLGMAETLQNPMLLTEAHRLSAESLVSEGEFALGQEHYQQAASYYKPALHQNFIATLGIDPGIIAQSQSAYFTWSLGHPDRAIAIGQQALGLARELNHPFSLAIALDTISALYHQLRNPQKCRDLSQECSDLSSEYRFPFWDARARMRRGWALAMMGHITEGIESIEAGIEAFTAMGSNISMPCMWALLAEAQLVAGDYEGCCSTTDRAIATIESLNERYCEVEIFRIRADYLAQSGDLSGAEAAYRHAIQIACTQEAKSLELRARYRFAIFLIEHGDPEQEIQLLKETYDWFEEGFDTADLLEVKTLLEAR